MTAFSPRGRSPAALLAVGAALALGGCTSTGSLTGDRVDYRTAGGTKTAGLDVPPDLTQLTRDSRYQTGSGSVSANAYQAAPPATAAQLPAVAGNVAPAAVGDVRLEKLGSERFLLTALPPEQLWPQLRAFWQERGFRIAVDDPASGTMETEWAENRARIPQDIIRRTIGRAFDNLYSTGERDKFRTRVERTPAGGSEIYLSHRGAMEVYSDVQRTQTVWQPRPRDQQLEAEMLSRIMVKLGAPQEQAKAAAATVAAAPEAGTTAAPAAAAQARLLEGRAAASLQIDDGFDRAWRRVGLALDRSGFTVEDRDRSQGQYFVRYVDPARTGREEPGFFGKLLSFGGRRGDAAGGPARYRISVKSEGAVSTVVSVLDDKGAPENGDVGRRIVRLLADELK